MRIATRGVGEGRLCQRTYAMVLAGGRGTRLEQLTTHRAKPAVPIAGKLNIIDFSLSNCVNSGIRCIGVLTQYKAQSLIRHLERGWGFLEMNLGEFIDIVPAQQRVDEHWYTGTADAVYQNLELLHEAQPEFVLVLAGDHVYKMDSGVMLAEHVQRGADVTVASLEVKLEDARRLGVLSINENGATRDVILGSDLAAGERPQAVVPAQAWQAAESLGDWTLVGCTVAPGFDFAGFELAPPGFNPAG